MTELTSTATLDAGEVDRFARMAGEWWDQTGKFRPLHKIGPVRLRFIHDHAAQAFHRNPKDARLLEGLSALDIGCGGGLIAEPLARLGARVTGIDPGRENIEVARLHAAQSGLQIDYRATTVEELGQAGLQFDLVLCLEVVEHVPDVTVFLGACGRLVRPGGLMIVSTIDRTLKSFALAIVGAEYVLRWLPRGTHQWDRFVRPDELERALKAAGLRQIDLKGMVYNPIADRWSLSDDTDVNYFAAAMRPEAS